MGGWLDQLEIRLSSPSVEVEVEAELSKKLFLVFNDNVATVNCPIRLVIFDHSHLLFAVST